jgi:hypothetical protein
VVLSAQEALDTSAELVSLDDPQAMDLENLTVDEDEDPEDRPG